MGTVILISTVAIIVAIVGCFFIWRLDAARAEEVDQPTPQQRPRHAVSPSDPPPHRGRSTPEHAPRRTSPAGGACHTRTGVVRWTGPRGRFEGTTSVCTEFTQEETRWVSTTRSATRAKSSRARARRPPARRPTKRSLEAEGKGDQAGANLKQAGEKVKDVFKG